MKKKIQYGVIICFSLILVACKKPESAKEATASLVNGLIYNKEPEKINKMFTYSEKLIGKEKETDLGSKLKESLDLDDSYDEQVETIIQNQKKNLMDKTSFEVNIIEEDKNKAKVEILVIGLEELNDEQLISAMESELELRSAELSAETTDEEMSKLVNDVSITTFAQIVQEQPIKSEPTIVILDLKVDPKDKYKWMIQKDENFMNQLFEAFGD